MQILISTKMRSRLLAETEKNNEFRFTGEALDPVTGLYYLRARYYDPELGRFISKDPLSGVSALPLSKNRYIYGENDPTKVIDPGGKAPEPGSGTGGSCPIITAMAYNNPVPFLRPSGIPSEPSDLPSGPPLRVMEPPIPFVDQGAPPQLELVELVDIAPPLLGLDEVGVMLPLAGYVVGNGINQLIPNSIVNPLANIYSGGAYTCGPGNQNCTGYACQNCTGYACSQFPGPQIPGTGLPMH